MRLLPLLLALATTPLLAADSPHGELSRECTECHSTESWTPVRETPGFRHADTGYVLELSHAKLRCTSCHESLKFPEVGTACADCHRDPHRGELGTRCELCHTPKSFSNQREMFQAHSATRFPLLAVHARLDCTSCHRNQQPWEFANTPTECGVCHAQTFVEARNPDHVKSGFSRRCEDCHNVVATTWRGARFADHDSTAFPLTGGHVGVSCERCHVGGRFTGTPTDCVACHQADYNRTSNPDHVASRFSTRCQECHQTAAWRPAALDHAATRFPLTGAHTGLACERCHAGGRFTGTPTQCIACHDADFRRVTNPSHTGFPSQCEECHSTAAWRPASLNHDQTGFPLTGAHRGLDCARCHAGGRYTGTPSDCVACHRSDYDGTRNPNHASAGFPTRCEDCHSTNTWQGASFDHDARFFPIFSGKHRGVWSACSECHVSSGNFANFECIRCHEHSNKARVDDDHDDVGGYVYQSQACYRCHPRGTEDDD